MSDEESTVHSIREGLEATIRVLMEKTESGREPVPYTTTGFDDLDKLIHGWGQGLLTVVVSHWGQGASGLCLTL